MIIIFECQHISMDWWIFHIEISYYHTNHHWHSYAYIRVVCDDGEWYDIRAIQCRSMVGYAGRMNRCNIICQRYPHTAPVMLPTSTCATLNYPDHINKQARRHQFLLMMIIMMICIIVLMIYLCSSSQTREKVTITAATYVPSTNNRFNHTPVGAENVTLFIRHYDESFISNMQHNPYVTMWYNGVV